MSGWWTRIEPSAHPLFRKWSERKQHTQLQPDARLAWLDPPNSLQISSRGVQGPLFLKRPDTQPFAAAGRSERVWVCVRVCVCPRLSAFFQRCLLDFRSSYSLPTSSRCTATEGDARLIIHTNRS